MSALPFAGQMDMSSVDMSSYPTLAFAMNAEEAQSSQMRVVFFPTISLFSKCFLGYCIQKLRCFMKNTLYKMA